MAFSLLFILFVDWLLGNFTLIRSFFRWFVVSVCALECFDSSDGDGDGDRRFFGFSIPNARCFGWLGWSSALLHHLLWISSFVLLVGAERCVRWKEAEDDASSRSLSRQVVRLTLSCGNDQALLVMLLPTSVVKWSRTVPYQAKSFSPPPPRHAPVDTRLQIAHRSLNRDSRTTHTRSSHIRSNPIPADLLCIPPLRSSLTADWSARNSPQSYAEYSTGPYES